MSRQLPDFSHQAERLQAYLDGLTQAAGHADCHRELHQGPHAADRAQERRADGGASGSGEGAPNAPVAASHRGPRGLER